MSDEAVIKIRGDASQLRKDVQDANNFVQNNLKGQQPPQIQGPQQSGVQQTLDALRQRGAIPPLGNVSPGATVPPNAAQIIADVVGPARHPRQIALDNLAAKYAPITSSILGGAAGAAAEGVAAGTVAEMGIGAAGAAFLAGGPIGPLLAALAPLILEIGALTAVTKAATASFQGMLAVSDANNLVMNKLIMRGGGGGFTATDADLRAQREDLTRSGVSRTVSAQSQSELMNLPFVRGQMFQATLEVAKPFSETSGQSYQQSVGLIGRALNSPLEGVKLLEAAGMRFTDQQKLNIKLLDESNQLGKAQLELFTIIQEKVQGAQSSIGSRFSDAGTSVGAGFENIGSAVEPMGKFASNVTYLSAEVFKLGTEIYKFAARNTLAYKTFDFAANTLDYISNWWSGRDMQNPAESSFTPQELAERTKGSLTGQIETPEGAYNRIAQEAMKNGAAYGQRNDELEALKKIEENTRPIKDYRNGTDTDTQQTKTNDVWPIGGVPYKVYK